MARHRFSKHWLPLTIAGSIATTSFGAETVGMTPFDGSEVSVAVRDQFVTGMVAESGADPEAFAWQRLDLDGDGYDELLVKLTGGNFCLGGDCPIIAFKRTPNNNWEAILTVVGSDLAFDADSKELEINASTHSQRWSLDHGFLD